VHLAIQFHGKIGKQNPEKTTTGVEFINTRRRLKWFFRELELVAGGHKYVSVGSRSE
jgi:hypothetical protein